MTLFNGNNINWDAYKEGQAAYTTNTPGNPYQQETDSWYSWNKGWNSIL